MSEVFKQKMNEWVALKAQLAAIKKDTQVLTKREKELREFITKEMKQSEIDTVKVKEVKVNLKSAPPKRKSLPKQVLDMIQRGLILYFGGDVAKVEGAINAIMDSAPEVPQKDSITVRGLQKLS